MNAIVMMALSVIVLIGFNGPVCAESKAEEILRSDFYRKVWAVGSAGVQIPLSILQGSKIRDIKVHSLDRHQRSISKPKKEIKI